MDFVLELLLEALSAFITDVVWAVAWAVFTSLFPSSADANERMAGLAWGAAAAAGGLAGWGSLSVMPGHVARGPIMVAAAWVAFPLVGGLAVKATTRLQRPAMRAPGIAFVTGALFAVAYLAVRTLGA